MTDVSATGGRTPSRAVEQALVDAAERVLVRDGLGGIGWRIAATALANADARVIAEPKGAVQFDAVSFRYKEDVPLIEELSLDVAPGQTIAIVGPTGVSSGSSSSSKTRSAATTVS